MFWTNLKIHVRKETGATRVRYIQILSTVNFAMLSSFKGNPAVGVKLQHFSLGA